MVLNRLDMVRTLVLRKSSPFSSRTPSLRLITLVVDVVVVVHTFTDMAVAVPVPVAMADLDRFPSSLAAKRSRMEFDRGSRR